MLIPENMPENQAYDLIGDVHGCYYTLVSLLDRLGYKKRGQSYAHPSRKAIFLGDFIDRGQHIREVLHLVYGMISSGNATCVMGNHEYNALTWSTSIEANGRQRFLLEHNSRHYEALKETLCQFEGYPKEWKTWVEWFAGMPIYLVGKGFRVVHACWDKPLIASLAEQGVNSFSNKNFLIESTERGSFAWKVADRLLRGTWMPLPNEHVMVAKDGFRRRAYRTKFWNRQAQTHGDLAFQPDPLPDDIAAMPLTDEERSRTLHYGEQEPLLFIGHYWQEGVPEPVTRNIACLDYSAVKAGRLAAYRMDNEHHLNKDNYVWVDVDPRDLPAAD